METKRGRGRPKIIKEGDLAEAWHKRQALAERSKRQGCAMVNRYFNRRGKMSEQDIKYSIKGRCATMISYSKYKLDPTDPIIVGLRKQCKAPPTIGILALTEMEAICGKLPYGCAETKKVLQGLEAITASFIYAKQEAVDKILTGYSEIDIDSSYPHELISSPMPTTLDEVVKGRAVRADRVCVYADDYGNFTFNPMTLDFVVTKTYLYNQEWYGRAWAEKWHDLKNEPKYKKLAKDILVCAIGAIHKYRFNLMARYIWYLAKTRLEATKDLIESHNCPVVKAHTDSIGWLGLLPENTIKLNVGQMGAFTAKHTSKRVYIISAGQYQVEGCKPVLSGISWGGIFLENDKGERTYPNVFPCIKRGDMIKSYEKDGIEFKELGREIRFIKGGADA